MLCTPLTPELIEDHPILAITNDDSGQFTFSGRPADLSPLHRLPVPAAIPSLTRAIGSVL